MARRSPFVALFATLAVIHSACSGDCSGGSDPPGGRAPISQVPPPGGGQCTVDSQCATKDPCVAGRCLNSQCVLGPIPDGPPPGVEDVPDDCIDVRCENGHRVRVPDNSEAPDDGNACTVETCAGGQPGVVNASAGTTCPAGECNAAGQCTGCTIPTDCGGSDTFCRTRTCEDSICGFDYATAGTPLPDADQKAGDCQRRVCDGHGRITSEDEDDDIPPDTGPCAPTGCDAGAPTASPVPRGGDCGDGKVCNDSGECVECVDDTQCTPPETCGAVTPYKCTCKPAATGVTCQGHCGSVTNNCGETVACGGCQSPFICFETACCLTPPGGVACGDKQCGTVVDSCGQTVSCGGSCTPPATCGGGGQPNMCGCTDDRTACQGKNCGTATNNCGQTLTCTPNNCSAPATCGGGGVANVCGCTDDGSACQGKNCGTVTNNCAQVVPCAPNNCRAPQTCGGGGTVNVCGCTDDGTACQGKECGTVMNNCGQRLTCQPDVCPPGTLCGTSTPNMCG